MIKNKKKNYKQKPQTIKKDFYKSPTMIIKINGERLNAFSQDHEKN